MKMAEAGAALANRKAESAAKLAERRSAFEEQVAESVAERRSEVAPPAGVGGGRASRVEVLHAAAGGAARRLNMSGVDAEDDVSDVGAAERKADVARLWPTL